MVTDWQKAKEAAEKELAVLGGEPRLYWEIPEGHGAGECPDCDYRRASYSATVESVINTLKAHGYVLVPERATDAIAASAMAVTISEAKNIQRTAYDYNLADVSDAQDIYDAMIKAAQQEMGE